MSKRDLILLSLFLIFMPAPVFAADGTQAPPVVVHDDNLSETDELLQMQDRELHIDQDDPASRHQGKTHKSNPVVTNAPCGGVGQAACPPAPDGVNRITGLPNNNANNTAAGGVNRITGQVNGVKSAPCGVSGQGPCSKEGPGGVNPTSGKVVPY